MVAKLLLKLFNGYILLESRRFGNLESLLKIIDLAQKFWIFLLDFKYLFFILVVLMHTLHEETSS